MFILYSLYAFSVIGFFIHLASLEKGSRSYAKIIELLLLYQIVFSLGMTSFLAFAGLTFMPEYIANYLAWPASPFEQELANVNLAFGVLGIIAIWLRGHFWTATILGFSIWIMADGVHHLFNNYITGNASPGNTEVPLYTDFIIPIILLILLPLYLTSQDKEQLVIQKQKPFMP